jgi:hypothetical protein
LVAIYLVAIATEVDFRDLSRPLKQITWAVHHHQDFPRKGQLSNTIIKWIDDQFWQLNTLVNARMFNF